MKKHIFIFITIITTSLTNFSQENSPKWVLKTNAFNLILKTSGLETEYYLPQYFSLSTAWYNTGGVKMQQFWWIGNIFTSQLNYYFNNKIFKGSFFSIFFQAGSWGAYHPDDKHKIAKVTSFGGGVLYGTKWMIFKSKKWYLEPRIGYKQTIALNKRKETDLPDNLPPTMMTQLKLDLNVVYTLK
jgi:hypothetical protein